MNGLKKITNVITSSIIILIILLPNNIYSMQKNEKPPKEVILGGELIQIEMQTNKVMVYGINNNEKLKNYDLIESITGESVKRIFNKEKIYIKSRSDIITLLLSMNNKETVTVNLIRNGNPINIDVNKKELNHSYLTEKIPYSATLTYIDIDKKNFGAVAHSLETKETKHILTKYGEIYLARLSSLQKSKKDFVGNVSGEKIYDSQGKVSFYSDYGINGKICSNEILKNKDIYKVADPEEVKKGIAYVAIKHNPNEEKKLYEIEITKVNKQCVKDINSFEFELKDKRLIKEYGGIVQGMSGCPIIQNGKIIGALSHVKTDNTKHGVGLYIKWMMED